MANTGKAVLKMRPELRPILREFAEAMEQVLRDNDYKGGWGGDRCPVSYLEGRMIGEAGEYFEDGEVKELVDIANFAMMIWSRLLNKPNINIK